MNKANQNVVIQSANINLINIRTFELNYFANFLSNFGTQSALMIGFISGSISQVPGFQDPTGAGWWWTFEYWVTSALCFGTAIAGLISAFIILVFAQGLAIRGPEGSMIRSIEGMIQEQQIIMIIFCLTLFFFFLQCMGMYYIMFDSTSGLITTIITGVAIIAGYHEAIRLYNRFYWGKVTTHFDTRDAEDDLNDLDPSLVTDLMSRKKKHKGKTLDQFTKKPPTGGAPGPVGSRRGGGAASAAGENSSENEGSLSHHSDSEEVGSIQNSNTLTDVTAESLYAAYLTLRDRMKSGREKWVRRYFLVKGHSLYYYRDKRAFELEPSKPINKRAIDLEGYTLVAGSMEAPYPISLVPYESDDIRKVWKFRCDTSSEFERWIQLFSIALQNCNPDRNQGELMMIADGKTEVVSVYSDDDYFDNEEGDEK